MGFLVDEDMPRSTARVLRDAGYEADDVRDIGLAGSGDPVVFAQAQSMQAILITGDLGFANLLTFPLGTHAGIIVVRRPNQLSIPERHALLLDALQNLKGRDLSGSLVIVELGRTRVRWPDG
jgi:predicted nuclease of predicted toxin-antitoxin system